MPQGWRVELWRLMGIALSAVIAGYLWGMLVCLLAASLMLLGWHLYQLLRLARWLEYGEPLEGALPRGLWGEVFQRLTRLQAENRKRKRRLGRFIMRFREAAAALPDATVILGRRGQIQWCNPAAQTLLGLSWPEVDGEPLIRQVHHPVLVEYLSNGDYNRPLELPSPTDKTKILSLRITPYGKKHQHLLMASDITRIYHLDQARRDFAANASHELRTPLTVVRGFLETLTEADGCSPDWPRSLNLMRQQTKRMQNIIGDLLMLSRMEMNDERTQNHRPVAVPELLAAIVEEARALSGEKGHEISLEAESDLWLKANEEELRSAFSNLVFNAVLHTPPRSEIRIRWCSRENGAELAVSDSGEGIGARHIPRLTERFYRVEGGRSQNTDGTGLGLAIVKHVLNRHLSELHIVSQMGKGSTFSCFFPAVMVIIADSQAAL